MKVRVLATLSIAAMALAGAHPGSAATRPAHPEFHRNGDHHWVRRPHADWHREPISPRTTSLCGGGILRDGEHSRAAWACSYRGPVTNHVDTRAAIDYSQPDHAQPMGRSANEAPDVKETPIVSDLREIPMMNDPRETPLK